MRPKKYNTEEERLEARRAWNKRAYATRVARMTPEQTLEAREKARVRAVQNKRALNPDYKWWETRKCEMCGETFQNNSYFRATCFKTECATARRKKQYKRHYLKYKATK